MPFVIHCHSVTVLLKILLKFAFCTPGYVYS